MRIAHNNMSGISTLVTLRQKNEDRRRLSLKPLTSLKLESNPSRENLDNSVLYYNRVTIVAMLIIPISEIILILRFLKIILNVTT